MLFRSYNISIKYDNEIRYNFFPKPHFSSKNLFIFNDKKKIGEVKNFKIFINFNNFFKFNQIQTQDVILDKVDFNIKKSDLSFFTTLLKTEPNRHKIKIKRSNLFFMNKDDEVLFINQINLTISARKFQTQNYRTVTVLWALGHKYLLKNYYSTNIQLYLPK